VRPSRRKDSCAWASGRAPTLGALHEGASLIQHRGALFALLSHMPDATCEELLPKNIVVMLTALSVRPPLFTTHGFLYDESGSLPSGSPLHSGPLRASHGLVEVGLRGSPGVPRGSPQHRPIRTLDGGVSGGPSGSPGVLEGTGRVARGAKLKPATWITATVLAGCC
jgi:hypothetical protein